MTRNRYKQLVLLMWIALPTAAWSYWRVWNQLPPQMAVHFNANGRPNGFASREGALQMGLGIMLVMLVVFTAISLMLHAFKPVAAWVALVFFYLVLSFCWYGNYSIVAFNLKTPPAHSELVGPSSPALRNSMNWTVSQLHS